MESSEFSVRQSAWTERINRALEELLAPQAHPMPPEYDGVRQAMAYSLAAGGKRIRPMLTLEFCRMLGGDPDQAMPLACAVELIHTYSLIHDDLPCMDDDDLRRGQPSCHKKFGEATALLAGDGLLTLAAEVIATAPERTGLDPLICLSAIRTLASLAGLDGMVGGQTMDLANEGRAIMEDTLRRTDELKTCALLKAACRMGALAAKAQPDQLKLADEYAEWLGLAFQMVDDILDVTGDEASLGKPIGSDAASGKCTYVTLCGLDGAQERANEATERALAAASQLPSHDFLCELTRRLTARRS